MRTLSLLLVMCLASGCFVSRRMTNEPIDPALLGGLVPGETSAAEVVARLGAPTEVVQLGRRSAYRFDAAKTKQAGLFLIVVGLFNEDTRSDRVWAFFDEEQVLTHFGATLSFDDPRWAMPWQGIHPAPETTVGE